MNHPQIDWGHLTLFFHCGWSPLLFVVTPDTGLIRSCELPTYVSRSSSPMTAMTAMMTMTAKWAAKIGWFVVVRE
jgi:hypothetical protein